MQSDTNTFKIFLKETEIAGECFKFFDISKINEEKYGKLKSRRMHLYKLNLAWKNFSFFPPKTDFPILFAFCSSLPWGIATSFRLLARTLKTYSTGLKRTKTMLRFHSCQLEFFCKILRTYFKFDGFVKWVHCFDTWALEMYNRGG